MTGFRHRTIIRLALAPAVLLVVSCAYYNTFYNAEGYYKDGMKLLNQKQASKAKQKFEKAIEKSAQVISRWSRSAWVDDATFLIGMSYYQMGQYKKAVKHFEQLAIAFPHSRFAPGAELHRGLALLRDGEYGLALVVLEDLRRRYPRMGDAAAYHLASSFYSREDYARAADSLAAFAGRYPRSRYLPAAAEQLADACLRLKRWDQAEYWYRRRVQLASDPKERALARLQTAGMLIEQGKYADAAQQAKAVLGRYRDLDDRARLVLGRAEYEQGRYKEALETWAGVRGTSDLGAEAFFRIGRHHEEHGDFPRAKAFYDTAKSRRADSDYGVLAVKRLALLDAFTSGDASGRAPAKAKFLLAEVHNLNLGDYDEAMRLYQSVYDSFPETEWAPKALLAKAWIQRSVKADSATAAEVLRRIIAQYPETEYADEARRWLGLPVPKRTVASPTPAVVPQAPPNMPKPESEPELEPEPLQKSDSLPPLILPEPVEPESTQAEPDSLE